MEKFKGTSNSWVSFKNDDDDNFLIQSNDGYNLAYVTATYVCDEETKANAKLIASAPELLEALQETDKDLCVLWGQMLDLEKTNPIAEGLSNLIQNWRDRNKQAINKALK